jgi:hypothetical protein
MMSLVAPDTRPEIDHNHSRMCIKTNFTSHVGFHRVPGCQRKMMTLCS